MRMLLPFLFLFGANAAVSAQPVTAPDYPESALQAPPPPIDSEVLSTLVNSEKADAPKLDLSRAMTLAIENNYTRKISGENVASARAAVEQARGPVLPQVGLGLGYQQVNDDQPSVESGFSPESQTALSLTASQMIYDDRRVTNLRSTRRTFDAAQEADRSVSLDIARQAGVAYVQVLSIASSLKIAEDNLRITRENLELARIRRSVGTSGPEEVLRFESEEAQQESELWSARNRLHAATNELNRILGETPDRPWKLEDLSLESEIFRTSLSGLIPLARGEDASANFRAASIAYALSRSPEIASLGFSAEARQLELNESRRSFFVPDVNASFAYNRILESDYPDGTIGPMEEEDTWTFMVTASLPLFEGGSRFGDIRQARSGLRTVVWQEARTRQAISTEVSNALAAMSSSWQSIRLSRIASEKAAANLEIVQDKYEQGNVSIVDLLDAQNNALVQRLTASIDRYRFFQDLLTFQRALSWMEPLADEESRKEFTEEFQTFLENS